MEQGFPDGVGDGGGHQLAGGPAGDLALDHLGVGPEVLEHVVVPGEGLGAAGEEALEGLLPGVLAHVPLEVLLALEGGDAAWDRALVDSLAVSRELERVQ